MEDISAVLKAAGWSDEVIKSFLNPKYDVVNPVPMSAYIATSFSEEYDELSLPKRMDSTSLVISQSPETKLESSIKKP